jgi:hypothetical protein
VALIIRPGNPEGHDPLGLDESFKDSRLTIVGILIKYRFDGIQHLTDRLNKFPFVRISCFDNFENI